ncbi:hypothetical protein BDW22DRAFT_1326705, partial [Trametopsis cervina]
TACLWTWDTDLDALTAWASRWKGPISVLVVTQSSPSSPEATELLIKLQVLAGLPTVRTKLSAHIIHLEAHTPENPNAFLNLARLFSQTDVVTLFPGNLSVVPPKILYRSVASESGSSKPVVFSMRQQATFPFTGFSPAVLNREDPLWCTERFFPSISRAADWTECLWQIWLEHSGNIEVKPTSDWIHDTNPNTNASPLEVKVRRRLSLKYRGETCVLATRQLAALRSSDGTVDVMKARWLKRHCREWMNGG